LTHLASSPDFAHMTSEDNLQRREERFRFAIQGSRLGIWDWNLVDSVSYYSPEWKAMLGYNDEDDISDSPEEWKKRVHPDDLAYVMATSSRHLQGLTLYYETEHRIQCKDGSYKWVLSRGQVVERDAAGNPLRIIGTHLDIQKLKDYQDELQRAILRNEQQQAEMLDMTGEVSLTNQMLRFQQEMLELKNEKLDQTNEELNRTLVLVEEQKQELQAQSEYLTALNKTKDRLFSIISHDLRNPMMGLKGLLELFNQDAITPGEFQELTFKLQGSLDGLQNTLENLLQWSARQMNGITTNPKQMNLTESGNEVIRLFTATAQSKQVHLFNLIKPATWVFADENHVQLILRNLISNALKFTPEEGMVTVMSRNRETFVEICIIDTGVGMDEETITHLFQDEVAQSQYGTKGERGTGLGLNLCREMIKKNRGRIWIKSAVGKGSSFIFTLPVKEVF
jgi:PAS domain S-box-containing protein